MKIVLVTGLAYRSVLEDVARRLRGKGFDVVVEVGDTSVASLVSPSLVESIARRYGRDAVIILPPALAVDAERLYRETGAVVVWGPSDPRSLPELLERLNPEHLEPGMRLEDAVTPVLMPRAQPLYAKPCGLPLYPSPPPVTILYEVMADRLERVRNARYAHGVIVGFPRGARAREAAQALELVSSLGTCWGVDSDNDGIILEAVDAGASIVLSVDPSRRELLSSLPEGRAVVLIPAGLGEKPPPPRARIEKLKKLAEEALEHKLVPVLDPLLAPPCLGLLDSLEAYRLASQLRLPVLAGLGNVYELVDADPAGVLALLASLLVEAGVSVFLVTSESWKARMAHLYAPIAAAMACIACSRGRPPKDLGIHLLIASEKRPTRTPDTWRPRQVLRAEDAEAIPFERDPAGDNIVETSGEAIRVIHRWPDGRLEALESSNPYTLYRAALAKGYATRLDHAAWLGFEIGVAYASMRLGRSYSSIAETHIGLSLEVVEKAMRLLSANPATRQRGARPPQTP